MTKNNTILSNKKRYFFPSSYYEFALYTYNKARESGINTNLTRRLIASLKNKKQTPQKQKAINLVNALKRKLAQYDANQRRNKAILPAQRTRLNNTVFKVNTAYGIYAVPINKDAIIQYDNTLNFFENFGVKRTIDNQLEKQTRLKVETHISNMLNK